MKAVKYFLFLSLFCITSCAQQQTKEEQFKYLRWIEDIPFDPSTDNSDFLICNGEDDIYQYFNVGDNIEIEGEKYYINKTFEDQYDPSIVKKESGLVRIRFIVNCNGDTDRYRVLTSDLDYLENKMDNSITDQLLKITKSLKGWKQKNHDGKIIDYYQYLFFRILDGQIIKILP